MNEEIKGRGTLEATGTPGKSFPVDCDIMFARAFVTHPNGLAPRTDIICSLCVVRRADRQPIPDGYYTLRIDCEGTSEVLDLKYTGGVFKPVEF
jgi:hypothetical protein